MKAPADRLACRRERCDNLSRPQSRGLCGQHYATFLRQRAERGEWVTGLVETGPVVEHLDRLRDAGLGYRKIAELIGADRAVIQRIRHHAYVLANTAARIHAIPVPETPRLVVSPGALLPNVGTRRRLQALVALGHSQRTLADHLGVDEKQLSRMVDGASRFVEAQLAIRVDKMFATLQLVPGTNNRARNRAAKNGWLPPFAWDEDAIDDPSARAHRPKAERKAWLDDYYELRAMGCTHAEIAERWGIQTESLRVRLARHSDKLAS